jgi:hypothetical protein
MDRISGSKTVLCALTVVLSMGVAEMSRASDPAEGTMAGQLPAMAEADTVRTNLWLTEALMGEIVSHAAAFMPPAPGAVLVVNQGTDDANDLFGSVAAAVLTGRGYDLFVVTEDSMVQAPVDYVFSYQVVGVELIYPEVGRTLGIWKRWIGREIAVTASVEVATSSAGQLLFKEIVVRRFSDRVDKDDFQDVESGLYNFTTAQTSGSGWQNRMEEIVVLGTLVGLIAVYFSNTGN